MTDRVAQSRAAINGFYRIDEATILAQLLSEDVIADVDDSAIKQRAARWIEKLRAQPAERTLLEDFMQRYSLSTAEGVALMAIAECFLRVPDTDMADKIIIDKITSADWQTTATEGEKLLTSFSGWGLSLSETILKQEGGTWGRLKQRLGLPIIRQAIAQAIKLLGGQFVCGRTIEEAIANAAKTPNAVFSFDMLGEGARTEEAALHYFHSYQQAIKAVGTQRDTRNLYKGNGISVKLSALHPRYEEAQSETCLPVLIDRVRTLALHAAEYNMLLTIDAEEADRLEMSLSIFETVWRDPDLKNYDGLGLAVQAYQKRSGALIDYLIALARETDKRLPIRLVKGAYWDSEIKRAQERGLSGFPVFTRKNTTDVSYLSVADKMLRAHDVLYPAFATHNAYTISAILELAQKYNCTQFEFQRLYGMGEQLYQAASQDVFDLQPCRIYAPVGPHHDLLAYLVRRLLENGANSSFVHQVYDKELPVDRLVQNPFATARAYKSAQHVHIKLPKDLYPGRVNPIAPDLSDSVDRVALLEGMKPYMKVQKYTQLSADDVNAIMYKAHDAFHDWNDKGINERAAIIERAADIMYARRDQIICLLVAEGKKTIPDAIAEWREGIDFCRYYAQQAREQFAETVELPGPTGESNRLYIEGRGVFVCISPWNFPFAIFLGQVAAALVTGNSVVAKPAEQTPTIADVTIGMLYEAGVPKNVLHLAVGSGRVIGSTAVAHSLTAGVVFTGSTETAWTIQRTLADRRGPIVPLIAETGGQNVMIVDSTALPEQVVDDVLRSSFYSAGQRCSALRVLFIQEEVAPSILNMLSGAMQMLVLGDPGKLSTDIGPVIDAKVQEQLLQHAENMQSQKLTEAGPPQEFNGHFVIPQVFCINALNDLQQENFGPLLHVVTYKAKQLDEVIDAINKSGYGLTLGIHSRIDSRSQYIAKKARVGNIYINRSMTGAVVGVQPFGGMGLSGTGPKAGGPHYLHRFVTEKTVTINTTAAGGNTSLTTLGDA